MTKIAIYIPSLGGGGAERVMQILANEFVGRGYEVDVLLLDKSGPYLQLLNAGVNIIDFGTKRVFKSTIPLIKYLKKEKPDVILSALTHTNLGALFSVKLAGVTTRVVVSERNSFKIYQTRSQKILALALKPLIKLFYPWSYAITCVSEGIADELRSLLPKLAGKIITIYNPVVPSNYIELMNENIDHPWLISKRVPCIISAGRLENIKDYSSLITAFAIVIKSLEARLIILGEGTERENLTQHINNLGLEKHVDLPGFVNNPLAFFKKADMFVLSSVSEGLPGVLIQAMAAGLPIVSTNCITGPSEILEDGKWGKLVPVGNAEAMANAIMGSLMNRTYPDVNKRAMDFSVNKSVDKYLEVMGIFEATS